MAQSTDINRILSELYRVGAKLSSLRSSCPWGIKEIEDLEFFRKYVTKGSKQFLQQFNGYKKLKPFLYTLYDSPKSPRLIDSNCLKRFGLSILRISWSEFSRDKGNKELESFYEDGLELSRSIYKRITENLDREDEDLATKLIDLCYDKRRRTLYNPFLDLVATSTLVSVFRKVGQTQGVILSLSHKKILKELEKEASNLLKESKSKFLDALSSYFKRNKTKSPQEGSNDEEMDLGHVKKLVEGEDFVKFISRKFLEKNGFEPISQVFFSLLDKVASRVRGKLSKEEASIVSDLKEAVKETFSKPGVVGLSDLLKVTSEAEAMSLARRLFSYYKGLEEIKSELESVSKKINSLFPQEQKGGKGGSKTGSPNGSRGGQGGQGNGNNDKEPAIPNSSKKKVEEILRNLIEEMTIIYEMIEYLTKSRNNPNLNLLKRAFSGLLRSIMKIIRSIAETLGLNKLLTFEGILAMLSELALQLT